MNRLHVVLIHLSGAAALPEPVRRVVADLDPAATFHTGLDDLGRLAAGDAAETSVLLCAAGDPAVLVKVLDSLGGQAPWPLGVLSAPMAAAEQQALVRCGVHAWASLAGTDDDALRSLLVRARARFERESMLRSELVQLRTRMDERKSVDKAKGLLMLARGMGEDEAFALIRQTAMHANLRLGEVSRSVIDAARWAEAINRAGQLRMLAQRLARLAAQTLAQVDVKRSREQRRQTAERVAQNLAALDKLDLNAECAAELQQARQAWRLLEASWPSTVTAEAMAAIDSAAEALLTSAEALTEALQMASGRRALRIVNLCGRQRMLSERLAKDALCAVAGAPDGRASPSFTAEEFERALLELEQAPLTSPRIRETLSAARNEWLRLVREVQGMNKPKGGVALVRSAEALVDTFDQLAVQYEHSLQVIMS